MEELDFQMLAEFALSKWYWGTGRDIEYCVRTMIDENLPYEYIKYSFNVSKNDYYYYLNLEIQELIKSLTTIDYNAIGKWFGVSESDIQKALEKNKKDKEGDME